MPTTNNFQKLKNIKITNILCKNVPNHVLDILKDDKEHIYYNTGGDAFTPARFWQVKLYTFKELTSLSIEPGIHFHLFKIV